MATNTEIIESFINAWANLNPEQLVAYFTEDGTYHNMPMQPVNGRENLLTFIKGFIGGWDKTNWEIINMVEQGDLVIAERIDHTNAAGKSVDLACVGVFEMVDGKIKVWRDYFDLGTYMKAMADG